MENLISSFILFSLYVIYPARAPAFNTTKFNDLLEINSKFQPGDDRSGYMQGLFQLVAMAVTLAISLLSGLLAGKNPLS